MPDLREDIARRQKRDARRLIPDEGETGHFLAVTGQNPRRFAFRQPPDAEIPRFDGTPEGVLTAPVDSLVRNTDDHTVWINTDGETAWQLVGTGVAGTFPIVYDDGTYTHEITATGGELTVRVTENADPTQVGEVVVSQGDVFIDGNLAVDITAGAAGGVIDLSATDGGTISLTAETVVEINTSFGSGDVSLGESSGTVDFVSGRVRHFQNVAPADAALANSSFAFWLDDTPGGTVLNIKAKDSGGTVRTGSIALT